MLVPLERLFRSHTTIGLAKPFSRDFDEQRDAANELFGSFLKFGFSSMYITEEKMFKGYADGYTEKEIQRVEETLRYQAAKYKCFF